MSKAISLKNGILSDCRSSLHQGERWCIWSKKRNENFTVFGSRFWLINERLGQAGTARRCVHLATVFPRPRYGHRLVTSRPPMPYSSDRIPSDTSLWTPPRHGPAPRISTQLSIALLFIICQAQSYWAGSSVGSRVTCPQRSSWRSWTMQVTWTGTQASLSTRTLDI